jgi:acetyl-CoA C-acetyltransferase
LYLAQSVPPSAPFGGSLADFEASELAGIVMKEVCQPVPALIRSKSITSLSAIAFRPIRAYAYVSRVASIQAGLPMESVAMTVNRLCSLGSAGHRTTAQAIMLGDCRLRYGWRRRSHVARRLPTCPALRTGARMGDTKASRHDGRRADRPVRRRPHGHHRRKCGDQVEYLARRAGRLCVESQRRAAAAIAEGRFKSQIVPIVKQTRKGDVVFDTDEHVKASTTLESWPR